ncbi:hypothetical protein CH341_16960 [Rhodoplanes roseus]|uniref:Uncharacterized protein n=1 Tax=Rhodoplanes roseus TaxID=29409 RepID=A0A327KXZ6_9BRAD|nr:hypothetical protein CH341_16960 [Rhodoplanes roseus]
MNDMRSGTSPAPLSAFADEVAGLAARIRQTRFRGSERYVLDTDSLRRELTDLSERMRRVASEAVPSSRSSAPAIAAVFGASANRMDRPALRRPVFTSTTDQHGRAVVVERRRRG